MKWSWSYIAQYIIEKEYDGYVDWDEEFFICPECDEPVYKCDYPYIDLGMLCPICETKLEEDEEDD